MDREIQSITIIDEIYIEEIITDSFGEEYPYTSMNKMLCPKVEIVFKDGSIIDTFLHERRCWVAFHNCLGKYQFTGKITENGAENKCNKCDNVIIGPIYIDRQALPLIVQKAQNEQKTSS